MNARKVFQLILGFCFLFAPFFSEAIDFEQWLNSQFEISRQKIMANISPAGSFPGTVVASTSRIYPEYYYHWVRDASVAMGDVYLQLLYAETESEKQSYLSKLRDFVAVTDRHQKQVTLSDLGEVKFHINGSPFLGPWGRPQNDGPALRALVLSQWGLWLLKNNGKKYVQENLYDGKLPTDSVVKKDLEYISHHWQDSDFDIWEEVLGQHFFTRLIQAKALNSGAELASQLGDEGAAQWYKTQSHLVVSSLSQFWDPQRKFIKATIHQQGGVTYKSGLDTAVILAVMSIGQTEEGAFSIGDERVLSTVFHLEDAFNDLYPINQQNSKLGPAMGRYPEDRYDGYVTHSEGNPWFLTTLGMASFHYRLALSLSRLGKLQVTQLNFMFFDRIFAGSGVGIKKNKTYFAGSTEFKNCLGLLKNKGDHYLLRVKKHMANDGSMSEQFNRHSGFMQGAENLTMSYTAFSRAYFSRKGLIPF